MSDLISSPQKLVDTSPLPLRRTSQRGFAATSLVVGLLMVVVVVGALGFAGITIARSSSAVQTSNVTRQLAQQTLYAIAQQADVSSGMVNALPAPGSTSHPDTTTSAFLVPNDSGGSVRDSVGTPFAYCPYDNRNAIPAAGFVKGAVSPTDATPVFALIGAGVDRRFQTNCETVRTTSAAAAGSDDLVRVMTGQQIVQGTAGTKYFGDPVQNVSDLAKITSASLGELRVVRSTGQVYVKTSTDWQAVSGGGGQAHTKLGYDLTASFAPQAVFRKKFLVSNVQGTIIHSANIPWVYRNVDEAEQSLPYWIQQLTTFFKGLENDTQYDGLIGGIPSGFSMPSGSWALRPSPGTDMDNYVGPLNGYTSNEYFELIVGKNAAGTEIYSFRFAIALVHTAGGTVGDVSRLVPFRMVYQTTRSMSNEDIRATPVAITTTKPACSVISASSYAPSFGFPLMFEPIALEIGRP